MERTAPPRSHDLLQGPIMRPLLLFALPSLGSNVLQSINGSINAVWVGQFLGEQGLAATANANLVMFAMLALVFGFGMATTIVIGQSMGRNDLAGMRRAVGAGLGLFVVLGIAAALIGWLVSPSLLRLLGTPADVYPKALTYLRVMFVGLPWGLLTIFLTMAIRGTGDAMTPLLLMLPGMVVDIVLNPILIRGLGPIPALGIMGSGLSTLTANLVSFMLVLGVIYKRDLPVRLRGGEFRYLIPDRKLVAAILLKGVPMGLQMIVMAGSALVMIGLVNKEGTDTVAAYGAINQLWTYVQMPPFAIGMAVSTMAAQNIGARQWHRIDRIAAAGVVINLAMTGLLALLCTLLSHFLLQLFLPPQGAALAIADHISLLATWSFVFMGVTMILSGVTRANGATLVPLMIMILAYIPGRLGAVYALRPLLGADALWWSLSIGSALSLALTVAFYFQGGWRNGVLLATKEEVEEFVQAEGEPAGRAAPNG